MAQYRDEAGNIWEVGANGQPVLVRAASAPQQPQQPRTIQLPPSPRDQAAEARAQQASSIAAQGNARADQSTQREAAKQVFDYVARLRDDYSQNQQVKNYETAWPSYIAALKTSPDGAGDLQLIYAYAKLMDPNSAVREGETKMVRGGQAWQVVSSLRGQLDGSGGKFSTEFRDRLRSELTNTMVQRNRAYNAQRLRYKADAEAYGVDPQRVIGPHVGSPDMGTLEQFDRERGAQKASADGSRPPSMGDGPALNIDPGRAYRQDSAQPGRIAGADNTFLADETHKEYDWEFARNLDAMLRAGASDAEMSTYARQHGYPSIDNVAPVREYLRKHPDYEGLLVNPPLKDVPTSAAGRFNGSAVGTALRNALPTYPIQDEMAGAINSVLNGTPYAQERDNANLMKQAANAAHPKAALLGTIGGALAGGYGLARFAPKLASSMTSSALRAGASGAALGAASGAGEANDNRLAGAGIGAAVGALGGAGGYKIGEKIVAPLVADALRTRAGQALLAKAPRLNSLATPRLDPTDKALIKASGTAEQLAGVVSKLEEAKKLGIPYAMPDADPRLRALAGMVSRASPEANAVAEGFLEPRLLGQNDRAIKAIESHLSPISDIGERARMWSNTAKSQAAPLYEEAFNGPNAIAWSERIQNYLEDPLAKKALAKSMETQRIEALAQGKKFDPTRFSVTQFDAAGEPIISKTPNLRTVDAIRRGYGEMLDSLPRDIHGKPIFTPRDRAIAMAKDSITQELDSLSARAGNPAYRDARQTYAQFMGMKNALEQGSKAAPRGTFARDIKKQIGNLSPQQLAEYQSGYATKLADTAAGLTDTANAFKNIYGGLERRAKIGVAFPEGAPRFAKQFDLERDMAKTAQEVLGGSQTARRQGLDSVLNAKLAVPLEIAGTFSGHGIPGAGTAAAMGFGKLAKMRLNSMATKNAEALAPILFQDATNETVAYLKGLLQRDEEVKMAARKLGAKMGLLGAIAGSSY